MIAPIDSLRGVNSAKRCSASTAISVPEHVERRSAASEPPAKSLIQRALGRFPTAAVVSSLVVGLTLGWLVKRKWNG